MKRREFLKTGAAALAGSLPIYSGGLERLFGDEAGTAKGARPNLLFIMADQWRKQAIGCMKQDKVSTPNLDKLAAQSAVFTNAYATVPVCSPNRACLLTGKYSLNNGLLCNETWLLPQHQTFGEVCKANGYQTAYLGKWHVGQTEKNSPEVDKGYVPPEYRHGFDHWYKEEGHKPFDQPTFIGDALKSVKKSGWEADNLEQAAQDFLTGWDKTKPFSMVVSFGPPHTGGGTGFEDRFMPNYQKFTPGEESTKDWTPKFGYGYSAPAEAEKIYEAGGECYQRPVRANVLPLDGYEKSKCVQGYYGAISSIDAAIGRLLARLESEGLAENTVVVFTADHGDMMGSHAKMAKDLWFQESAGVPLMMRWPGKIPVKTYANVTGTIDLMPTVLGLLGLAIPGEVDGSDYSALMRGGAMQMPEVVYSSYFQGSQGEGPRHFRSAQSERYTYVLTHGTYAAFVGAPEVLYDRESDPYEMKPIFRGQGRDTEMDKFKGMLTEHLRLLKDPFLEMVWAGGPNAAKPDNSFYDGLIDKAFPSDPKWAELGRGKGQKDS
jgi:arylsulfatase A-like enzyme